MKPFLFLVMLFVCTNVIVNETGSATGGVVMESGLNLEDNYLNIWDLTVYEVVGAVFLVVILGIILLTYYSMKWAIPFQVQMALVALYCTIIVAITGNIAIWTFIVLGVGLTFYWVVARALRRN